MAEKEISAEMVINDAIKLHPDTLTVFHRYDIDTCCGGAETIAHAAMARGIDLEQLMAELEAVAGGA